MVSGFRRRGVPTPKPPERKHYLAAIRLMAASINRRHSELTGAQAMKTIPQCQDYPTLARRSHAPACADP